MFNTTKVKIIHWYKCLWQLLLLILLLLLCNEQQLSISLVVFLINFDNLQVNAILIKLNNFFFREEIARNRATVLEINHFLDIQKEEFDVSSLSLGEEDLFLEDENVLTPISLTSRSASLINQTHCLEVIITIYTKLKIFCKSKLMDY